MALDSDFRISGRLLEWKTKLPGHPSTPLTSPTFSLLGSEWYLRISFSTGGFLNPLHYAVCLIPKIPISRPPRTPFGVATYASHPADASTAPVGWRWCEITSVAKVDIWTSPRLLDSAFFLGRLKEALFVCVFHGADPSPVGAKTEPGSLRPTRTGEKSVQVSTEVPRDVESLSSDLSHLLEKEILPDVRLECGGRTFRAHRSVLGARSEVFRAMFQNATLESETGTVKIPDVDVGVLQKLLKFVYTGKPDDLSEDGTADLYEAADKYAVHSLKTACTYWIERNLTVENFTTYLVVADSHSDSDFKAAVVSFILENPSVMKSEAWRTFSKQSSQLANEVLHAYVAATIQ